MPRAPVLISRCLLGIPCRYHGRCTTRWGRPIGRPALVARLRRKHRLIPVCPETDAGLPTPRPPTRIVDGRWIMDGIDVSDIFERGAQIALEAATKHGCEKAYLLRGSPSCDRDVGATGILLRQHGFIVRSV